MIGRRREARGVRCKWRVRTDKLLVALPLFWFDPSSPVGFDAARRFDSGPDLGLFCVARGRKVFRISLAGNVL